MSCTVRKNLKLSFQKHFLAKLRDERCVRSDLEQKIGGYLSASTVNYSTARVCAFVRDDRNLKF